MLDFDTLMESITPTTHAPVTTLAPPVVDTTPEPGDHDRFTHIVLEGFHVKPEDDPAGIGGFHSTHNSVVDGMVNGMPVVALCGKLFVPNHNPAKYGLCPTCKEEAVKRGWKVPTS